MATSAAVAAAVARAKREIQHHFFSQDAVRPERAVPFDPEWRLERRQLERMKAKGIVREAKPGLLWLDVVAYDLDLTRRYRTAKTALLIVVFAALIALGVGVLIFAR
jgi:hypothetical protein